MLLLRYALLAFLLLHVAHSRLQKLRNKRFKIFGIHRGHHPQQSINRWYRLTADQMNVEKKHTMSMIGSFFVNQLNNDEYSEEVYNKVIQLLAPNMKAQICNLDTELNQYQFANQLRRKMKSSVFTKPEEQNVTYTMIPTFANATMAFIVAFQQKTTFDFIARHAYRVEMRLELLRSEPIHNSNFIITGVHILGDCVEMGGIDYEQTFHLTVAEKDLWKEDDEAQKLMRKIVPAALQYTLHMNLNDTLPMDWLSDSLLKSDEMEILTCQEEEPVSMTSQQFAYWWSKFRLLWHPKVGDTAEESTTLQMIKFVEGEEFVARLTFHLQIGRKEENPKYDWNLMIKALYNKKGDNRWHIQKMEMACPLLLDLRNATYYAVGEVIEYDLERVLTSKQPWWSAISHYIYGFYNATKHPYQVISCGETVEHEFALEHQFYKKHGKENAIIWAFEVMANTYENMITGSSILVPVYFKDYNEKIETFLVQSEWIFSLIWDPEDLFYYVAGLVLTCTSKQAACKSTAHCKRIGRETIEAPLGPSQFHLVNR